MPVTNYIWDPSTDALLMEEDDAGVDMATYTNETVPHGSQTRSGVKIIYQE